jgi:hypothetical protein
MNETQQQIIDMLKEKKLSYKEAMKILQNIIVLMHSKAQGKRENKQFAQVIMDD